LLIFDGTVQKTVPLSARCYDEEALGISKFTTVTTAGVKSMTATVYFTAETPQEISYVTDSDLDFGMDCWTDDLGQTLKIAGLNIIVATKEANPSFSGQMKVRVGWHYYGNTVYQVIALCPE
jgi:hypothetical protein